MTAIPLDWIKHYVDQFLEVAGRLPEGKMRDAALLRAEHAMDLVQAWKESKSKGGGASGS